MWCRSASGHQHQAVVVRVHDGAAVQLPGLHRWLGGQGVHQCGLECADSSVRTRVCGLECADSSVRTRVCGLECADSSVRTPVCGLQCAHSSVRTPVCGRQCADSRAARTGMAATTACSSAGRHCVRPEASRWLSPPGVGSRPGAASGGPRPTGIPRWFGDGTPTASCDEPIGSRFFGPGDHVPRDLAETTKAGRALGPVRRRHRPAGAAPSAG